MNGKLRILRLLSLACCAGILCGTVFGIKAFAESRTDMDTAIELCGQKRYNEALAILDSMIIQNPSDVSRRRYRAVILGGQKKYADALKDLKILVDNQKDPQSIFERGWLYAEMGKHQAAVNDFTLFMKTMKSGYWAAFNARAKSYFALSDYKRCLSDCNAALKESECRQTFLLRADALEKLGNATNAQKDREHAKALEECPEKIAVGFAPNTVSSNLYSARRLAREGNLDEALDRTNKALQLDSKSAEGFMIRALIHEQKKNQKEALKDLSSAIVNAPNDALAYSRRAALYMRQNQTARALSDYDKCVNREPNDSYYRFCRAVLRLKLGNFKGAVEDCTLCLDKDASIAAYEIRARAFEKLKNEQGQRNDRNMIRVLTSLPFSSGVIADSNSQAISEDLLVGGNSVVLPFSLPANLVTPLEKFSAANDAPAATPAGAKAPDAKAPGASSDVRKGPNASSVITTQGNLRKDAFGINHYDVNTVVYSDGRVDVSDPGKPFGSIRLYRSTLDGRRLPEE